MHTIYIIRDIQCQRWPVFSVSASVYKMVQAVMVHPFHVSLENKRKMMTKMINYEVSQQLWFVCFTLFGLIHSPVVFR